MKRAFTLIELLVVISIIGLLSSVVLASLNAAREKGRIAAGQQFAASIHHAAGSEAVGLWEMEDGSGATNVSDLSGNGNIGTLNGSTAWTTDTPFVSKKWSLSFNGSLGTDYVSTPYTTSLLASTSGFTWTAWIKPSPASLTGNVIFMSQSLPYLAINTSKLFFSIQAASAQRSMFGTTTLVPNKWYFVTATYDSNGYMKIYLDGKFESVNGPWPGLNPSTVGMNIGRHPGPPYYWYTGNIASVRFYNGIALAASDIAEIYASESQTLNLAANN